MAYNKKVEQAFANVPYWIIDHTFLKNRRQRFNSFYGVKMWDFTIADFTSFVENLTNDKECQSAGRALKAIELQRNDITPNNFRRLHKESSEKLIQACANVR